jgi:hypothetical protein
MATDPNAVPDELYALRSRVAAQDAELSRLGADAERLRGLVGRLASDVEAWVVSFGGECNEGEGVEESRALMAEARAEVPR